MENQLKLDRINKNFEDGSLVLKDISLNLPGGDKTLGSGPFGQRENHVAETDCRT
jgi:hypothetical protein